MKLLMNAIASVVLASAASANTGTEIVVTSEVPTARISYADLDLQSDAGRAALAKRIESAADDLCTERTVEPVGTTLLRRDCYRTAVASGFTQMGALVTARIATGSAAGR